MITAAKKETIETLEKTGSRHQRRWSITTALSGGFSILVFVALASGLIFAFDTAYRNTQVLVSDKAVLIVESVSNHIRQHLQPVAEQIEYLAALIKEGRINIKDPQQLQSHLAAALAATPQVNALIYIDTELKASRMIRATHKKLDFLDWSDQALVKEGLQQLRKIEGTLWGEIVYVPEINSSVVNVRISLYRDEIYLGALVASVRFDELSQYITRINARHDAIAFILLGKDQVLAHPKLVNGYQGLSEDQPLPLLKKFDDEILRFIWDERYSSPPAANQMRSGYSAHISELGEGKYVFVYEQVQGFGKIAWTVGCYFKASSIGAAFDRLRVAYWVGVVILLFSIGVTYYVGYKISRPIRRLAVMANQINERGLDQVQTLPPSRLNELNSAATAFNDMVDGLRDRELMRKTFGRYVPESVAGSILQDRGILKPQKR
ncbi:HAMP domain-containing protein, partial [Pseudomonadota bacterium]